jgi:hypothetical protein
MTRGLTWPEVRAVLDEFNITYEISPLGFTIRAPYILGFRNSDDDWRVRCGSGIAGRGYTWMIVRVTNGFALSKAASTKTELRRALREFFAGPIPDPKYPEQFYATKHSTRFQSGHYIWKRRATR